MSELGFSKTEEYLPQFDWFKDNISKRKLFLEFFNFQVCQELRFNKQEIKACKGNLCDIFMQKFMGLLDVSFVPFVHNISPKESRVKFFFDNDMQTFIKKQFPTTNRTKNQTKSCQLALQLFQMMEGTNLTLKINAQTSFEQFIMKKLLKDQKTRRIHKECDCINIVSSKEHDIKILPYWKLFENEKQCIINEHISKAVQCIKETSFQNIYLVYPKNDNFNKHLQVKIPEFEQERCKEYGIKIIPYSLRSILR